MNNSHTIVTNFSTMIYSDNFIELVLFLILSMLTRTFNTLKEAYEENIYVLLMYQIVLNLFYTYIIVLFVLFLFQLEFMIQYKDITNLIALILLIVAVFTSRETKVKFFKYVFNTIAKIINLKIESNFDTKGDSDGDNGNRTNRVD